MQHVLSPFICKVGGQLNSTHFGDSRHSNPSWNSLYNYKKFWHMTSFQMPTRFSFFERIFFSSHIAEWANIAECAYIAEIFLAKKLSAILGPPLCISITKQFYNHWTNNVSFEKRSICTASALVVRTFENVKSCD